MGEMGQLENLRGARVLVTGHTGFKGAWLVALLRRLGATVLGYSLEPPTEPSLFEEADLSKDVLQRIADIRSFDVLQRFVEEQRPDVVMHLAAQPIVLAGLSDPMETFEINVQGTVNVLEVIRSAPSVKAAVIVTSDKCYVPRADRAVCEDDALGGHDPYSASKAAAEVAVKAYRESYFKDAGPIVASVRAGNVIGGGDWAAHRLVADLARAAHHDAPLALRHPHAVRPWQHVFDASFGYLQVADRALSADRTAGDAWNFGPNEDDHLSVQSVVDEFVARYGKSLTVTFDHEPRPENPVLRLDSQKSRTKLGWKPVRNSTEAIASAATWYRARSEGLSVRELLFDAVDQMLSETNQAS